MSEPLDYPNKQVLGLDPPWVEGTGGGSEPKAAAAEAPAARAANGPDLDSMTKQELLEFAKQLDVSPANNDLTKEELRAGIDAKLGN